MSNQLKIKSLLDKINWLFKSFEENNFENVSALEKALLKEKILMFYDEVENLNTKIQKENIENNKNEPKVYQKVEEIKKEILEKPIKFVEKIDETIVPVEKQEIKPIIKEYGEEKPFKKVEITPKPPIKEIPNPVVNKFDKSEAFHKQVSMPKRDLREIIDLNKSFIFKAELFSQNNDMYNKFLNELNTTQTEDDAFSVIINWTEKLKWNTEENKAYDLLLRSVEKRFLPLIN